MQFQLTKIGGKLLVQKTLRMQFSSTSSGNLALGRHVKNGDQVSALLESASSLSEEVKEVLYSR